MRVYVTPCESHPQAWRNNCESLRRLAIQAEPRHHELVDRPSDADIILITDLRRENNFASLRANQILAQYPEKCFVCTDVDRPIPLVRGVYASMPRTRFDLGRLRAGFYLTDVSEWRNPFVSPEAAIGVERDLLFSFIGRDSAPVRRRLFDCEFGRPDVFVADVSSTYSNWDRTSMDREQAQRSFVEIAARSRFVLCPRGWGSASIRLFEVLEMGLVPVVLSDAWVAPSGPRWQDFAVVVPERQVPRLVDILESYEDRWEEMGTRAREAWLTWFSPPKQFNYVVDSCVDINRTARISERTFRHFWPPLINGLRVAWGLTRARATLTDRATQTAESVVGFSRGVR